MVFQRLQQRRARRASRNPRRASIYHRRCRAACRCIMCELVNAATIDLLRRARPGGDLVMGTRLIATPVLARDAARSLIITPASRPNIAGCMAAIGRWPKPTAGISAPRSIWWTRASTPAAFSIRRGWRRARPTPFTYPYLQLAAGLPLLAQAVGRCHFGLTIAPKNVDLPSRLWSHPTLWGYLVTALRRGVW